MLEQVRFNKDGSFGISGLGIKDIEEAVSVVTKLVAERQIIIPFEIHIRTWDISYVDVFPAGYVFARPVCTCWAAPRRLVELFERFPVEQK